MKDPEEKDTLVSRLAHAEEVAKENGQRLRAMGQAVYELIPDEELIRRIYQRRDEIWAEEVQANLNSPEKRELNMAQFRANFERAKHYSREASPQVVTQIEQAFDVELDTEPWTCDNHREPITYTDGTAECYCGNKK